jgi:hypothetical protein
MRGFHNGSFDPQTLVLIETAFDEGWLTLKSVGNKTVKPDELARCVLRVAMEGERDPVHNRALNGLTANPRPPGARRTGRAAVPSRRSAAKMLTKDQVRRIAAKHGEAARATAQDLIGSCPYGDRTEQ